METQNQSQIKYFLPKCLVEDRIDPVFDRKDIIYFKFVKNDKITEVTRADPIEGLVLVLKPTNNPNQFIGEGFRRIEDISAQINLKGEDIGDKIWLALIDRVSPLEILKGYEPQPLGVHPSGSYYYCKGGRTFHIVEMQELSSSAGA